MDQDGYNHRDHRDHKAVKQGTPEICHTHCLREVRKAPALRQGQDSGDAVCHLAGLLERDHDRHIEWKSYSDQSNDQQNRNRPVYSLVYFLFHYNCSSLLLVNVI